ncbi:unnamed protein product [Sphagnum jensenii]|uniref:Uncharacterized protein n=1 Tax=Sphagnum jensenii TaxID=128206 RepID=A0ABP0X601_9BRYO
MSLVDYASDDDAGDSEPQPMVASPSHSNQGDLPEPRSQSAAYVQPATTPLVRLPDATELLGGSMQEGTSNNSTGDHASRVATAMATSRKRPQLNGGAHALHSTKFPRRNITPSGTTMSSTGGILVPPQIRGRSNVSTEDLDRLFVRRPQRRSE